MTTRRWLPALGVAVLFTTAAAAADDPKGAAGDPLPEGAKVRLGTTRMRDFASWTGVTLAPDGKFLVTLAQNNRPVKIDVTTGVTTGGQKQMYRGGRVELSADGKRGVSSGYGGSVVFDAATGATKAKVDGASFYGGDAGVSLSADGKVIAVGGSKDEKKEKVTALVWDVEKNAKRAEVEVLQNNSANVALSADGTILATWGGHFVQPKAGTEPKPEEEYGRVVQFWDAATGKERARYWAGGQGGGGGFGGFGVTAVALAPDGKTAAVVSNGVKLVDTATGAVRRHLFGRSDLGGRPTFSPDGKRVAVSSSDGTVQMYDAATGARASLTESPIAPLGGLVRELKFTGPETAVVWATVGATAVVWEVPSGRVLSPFGGHTGTVEAVAFAPDGKTVLTAGGGGIMRWDPATGKRTGEVRLRAPGRSGPVDTNAMRFGPDTRTVRSGGYGDAAVYDAETGRQLFDLRGASERGAQPIPCDDGRTVLYPPSPPYPMPKDPPKSMRVPVWDTTTGAKLAEIETRFGTVTAAAVSPDRTKVVTLIAVRAGDGGFKSDYFVTGWDLATGKKLGDAPAAAPNGMQFMVAAPDNATVLITAGPGKMAVVDYVTGKAVREIEVGQEPPTAVSPFSADGKWFAAGSGYGPKFNVRVYEWQSGKTARTFRGHDAGVLCLAFSPDGKTLASGSVDTTVLLWDLTAK